MTIGGKNADYHNHSLKIKFDVPEVQRVMNHFTMYSEKTQFKIKYAIASSLKNIEKGAKMRVSRKSGKLARSITSSFDMKTASGSVSANQFYAHFIEFGAKAHNVPPPFMKAWTTARPYMRPSYENEKTNLIRNIKKAVKP